MTFDAEGLRPTPQEVVDVVEAPTTETVKATLDNNHELYMANGFQPMEWRQIVREGEEPRELPVSGVVKIANKTLWIAARVDAEEGMADNPERITAHQVEEDEDGVGHIISSEQIDPENGHQFLFCDDETTSSVRIEHQLNRRGVRYKGQWRLNAYNRSRLPVEVTVAEAVHPHVEPTNQRSRLGRLGKAMLGLGLLGTALTHTIDLAESVNPFYHAAGDTRAMLAHSQFYSGDIADVANLMGDLQAGDKKAIITEAETYAEQNPSEVMTVAQRRGYLNQVNAAQTNGDAINALSNFMNFYGKGAVEYTYQDQISFINNFNETKTPIKATQALADSVINSYGILPVSIVKNARFDTLFVGNQGSGPERGVTTTFFDGGKPFDAIALTTDDDTGVKKDLSNVETMMEADGSQEWIDLHELGHANQSEDLIEESKPGGFEAVGKYMLHAWTETPEFTSPYVASANNLAEPDADVFAAATTPVDRNGLASPDTYLRFHSVANQKILARLTQFDGQAGDGAAAWIIAHDKRLMGDSVMK